MSSKQITLGDVIDTQKGFAFKSSWFNSPGSTIPVVKVTNFTDNSIDIDSCVKVTSDTAHSYERFRLSPGDVVVQTVGSWPSNPASVVGKCVRVPSNLSNALLNQNALVARPKDTIDQSYLYYLLRDDNFKNYIVGTAQGAASQAAITLESIRAFKFLLPDIGTQQKIAAILTSYDELIQKNLSRIVKLETKSHLLYRHYFEVPEADDWEEIPLSEMLVVHRGKSYKSSELSDTEGLPFVNLKCVNRGGGFRKSGLKLFTGTFKENQRVEMGDLVMAVTDMTQERMIVARVARVPSLEGGFGVISMDMVKLEPRDKSAKDYLYAMLRWSRFADEVKNHANGANVLHLLPARITDYSTPIPPLELQVEFSNTITPLLDLIDNLQKKNEALAKARDLLLSRLLSGEIEV